MRRRSFLKRLVGVLGVGVLVPKTIFVKRKPVNTTIEGELDVWEGMGIIESPLEGRGISGSSVLCGDEESMTVQVWSRKAYMEAMAESSLAQKFDNDMMFRVLKGKGK